LDFNGNFIWAQKVTRSLDTLSTDISYGLGVDPFGNVIVFGRFGLSADLDPGTSDEIHTASGAHDIFLGQVRADVINEKIVAANDNPHASQEAIYNYVKGLQ